MFPFALAHRTVSRFLPEKLFSETPNRAAGTVALPVFNCMFQLRAVAAKVMRAANAL